MPTEVSLPTARTATRLNLLAQDLNAMDGLVRDMGWPRHRSQQILRWIHRHRVREIERMTSLSLAERARLSMIARVGRFDDCRTLTSSDGTKKFLARLEDGLMVESVLIPDGRRLTLCLSTQVGCTLDCRFCLTGTMGLKRNLRAHEIVDQVLTVQDHLGDGSRLTNLVFMGMGEPLANFEAVSEAIARLTNPSWGLAVPARRITLSTSGIAPRLKQALDLGITLAISLNATSDAVRTQLMPAVNRLYPLDLLLETCRTLPLQHRRRLTFEYVLLDKVNDSQQDARRLTKLLQGIRCKVNLIPFNEFPGSPFRRPADTAVSAFQSTLRRAGLTVFLRKSRGRDVLGACGQLGDVAVQTDPVLPTPAGAFH